MPPRKSWPNSAEGVILHFYASRMRGDQEWEKLLVPERSPRLERKLAKIASWSYLELQLLKRKVHPTGEVQIKARFSVEIDGKMDAATDDVGAQEIEGTWYVTHMPT